MSLEDIIGRSNLNAAVEEYNNAISHANAEIGLFENGRAEAENDIPDFERLKGIARELIIRKEAGIRSLAKIQVLQTNTEYMGAEPEDVYLQIAEDFDIRPTIENGVFRMRTPIMFLRNDGKTYDSKTIGAAAYSATCKFVRDNNIKTPVFRKAKVTITHHFTKEIVAMNVPDADNMDTKRLLDSIDGLIIPNDDLVTISLCERGVMDEKAYSEITAEGM